MAPCERASKCCRAALRVAAALVGVAGRCWRSSRSSATEFYTQLRRPSDDPGDLRHEPRSAGRASPGWCRSAMPRSSASAAMRWRCCRRRYEAANLWLTLPVAVAASALAALVIGVFVVRTSGIYFIMVTLAFAQMVLLPVPRHQVRLGGSDGIYINFKPCGDRRLGAVRPGEHARLLLLRAGAAGAGLPLPAACCARPSGACWRGIRSNEHRMRSLGFAHLPLQARRLHAGRRARRAGGLSSARRSSASSIPSSCRLALSGRRDHDGDPRRHGHPVGAVVGAFASWCCSTCQSLPAIGGRRPASTGSCGWALFIVLVGVCRAAGPAGRADRSAAPQREAGP